VRLFCVYTNVILERNYYLSFRVVIIPIAFHK